MASPEPYTISIPDAAIEKLHRKLADTDFPPELEASSQWPYGAPLSDIQRLASRWANGFSWRTTEASLNTLPNYKTQVSVSGFGPISLHFIWQKSPNPNALPLLFCHGWPGSFLEVTKLLPLLATQDTGPAFTVVAPSLPNFGFSSRISKPGFGLAQYAEALHALMQQLGYTKYATQGGDWGFFITRIMGARYPSHVVASHLNFVRANQPSFTAHPLLALQHAVMPYTATETAALERARWFRTEGNAYRLLQATKPMTLAYAFASSPVALLAWIYEKLVDWTDGYAWSDDEVLAWVSVYWFAEAGPSAHHWIYYEAAHAVDELGWDRAAKWVDRVKYGLAYFPKELANGPKTWGKTLGKCMVGSFPFSSLPFGGVYLV